MRSQLYFYCCGVWCVRMCMTMYACVRLANEFWVPLEPQMGALGPVKGGPGTSNGGPWACEMRRPGAPELPWAPLGSPRGVIHVVLVVESRWRGGGEQALHHVQKCNDVLDALRSRSGCLIPL